MVEDALARRVRRLRDARGNITEKRMFGGVCFLLRGNMLCGTTKDRFMFRVGKDQHAEALSRRGARPMDFTGKAMQGFVFVDPAACDARGLNRWIELAIKYVGALPPKKGKS